MYKEEVVFDLYNQYKQELKKYCEQALKFHIENGNEEVYVFALQLFPGHHYQLATMNTTESIKNYSGSNPYQDELYNPACFDCEFEAHELYEKVENNIRDLHSQFFELTDEYSEESFSKESKEYLEIKQLEKLAGDLFVKNSVDVINSLDFSLLNKSEKFCAIIDSHEFTENDFYRYAQLTIPEIQFNKVFPNAFRIAEDYLDFSSSTSTEIVQYYLKYISDFYLGTVPRDRYYTEEKVYEYCDKLLNYQELIDIEIISIIEKIVLEANPNPHNQIETFFISMFSPEGLLANRLLWTLKEVNSFSEGSQARLVELFKKVITGMKPSVEYPSFIHRDLALVIKKTDQLKYPELEFDPETSYLINMEDFQD